MNLFTSVYKAAFGTAEPPKERGPTIAGSFFLHRKGGLRNPRECLLINGVLSIRDHGNFTHVLVVEPAIEEGQEELVDDDNNTSGREYTCPLSRDLHLTGPDLKELQDHGLQYVITWSASAGDKNSDSSERYEFMCPDDTDGIQEFEDHLWNCLYESDTKSPAKPVDVRRWKENETGLFRQASEDEEDSEDIQGSQDEETDSDAELANQLLSKATISPKSKGKEKETIEELPAFPPVQLPKGATTLQQFKGDLYQFVVDSFKVKETQVRCEYQNKDGVVYFVIFSSAPTSKGKCLVAVALTEADDVDSWTFNDNANFVSFNVRGQITAGVIFSPVDFTNVREYFVRVVFERKNGPGQWDKLPNPEREYIKDSYVDVLMEDAESELSQSQTDEEDNPTSEEEYESEEEEDDVEPPTADKNKNLEIGYKDRTFVTRGNMVGVFSNDNQGGKKLQFVTNIQNIRDKNKRAILPNKVMLHQQDTNLILKDSNRPDTLFKLDLETGQIADEMRISGDMIVRSFGPNSKFAQQEPEQTFTGLSTNTVFRVDPRLSGDRIVSAESKTYSGKPLFSSLATTEKGGIALASEKGEIKLFDRLGIRAKTALPGSGDPIFGVDVSADGKFLVVTGKDHLLFIDTTIKEGKNKDESGFYKSFPANAKPKPIRLKLKPEHRMIMGGDSVSFTPAKFNTGKDLKESTVVTSTGPYVITWNVRRVLLGHTEYRVSKFNDDVVAENFRFGGDKEIIVTLPSQVLKAQSATFTQPTRQSLSGKAMRAGQGIVENWS